MKILSALAKLFRLQKNLSEFNKMIPTSAKLIRFQQNWPHFSQIDRIILFYSRKSLKNPLCMYILCRNGIVEYLLLFFFVTEFLLAIRLFSLTIKLGFRPSVWEGGGPGGHQSIYHTHWSKIYKCRFSLEIIFIYCSYVCQIQENSHVNSLKSLKIMIT